MKKNITPPAGPMATALDLFVTALRVGSATDERLNNLFKLAEKADAALAAQEDESERFEEVGPVVAADGTVSFPYAGGDPIALGELVEVAERYGIDNWREATYGQLLDAVSIKGGCGTWEVVMAMLHGMNYPFNVPTHHPGTSGFLLTAEGEPLGLFASADDALEAAHEAQQAGAINLDDEVVEVMEFQHGKAKPARAVEDLLAEARANL